MLFDQQSWARVPEMPLRLASVRTLFPIKNLRIPGFASSPIACTFTSRPLLLSALSRPLDYSYCNISVCGGGGYRTGRKTDARQCFCVGEGGRKRWAAHPITHWWASVSRPIYPLSPPPTHTQTQVVGRQRSVTNIACEASQEVIEIGGWGRWLFWVCMHPALVGGGGWVVEWIDFFYLQGFTL